MCISTKANTANYTTKHPREMKNTWDFLKCLSLRYVGSNTDYLRTDCRVQHVLIYAWYWLYLLSTILSTTAVVVVVDGEGHRREACTTQSDIAAYNTLTIYVSTAAQQCRQYFEHVHMYLVHRVASHVQTLQILYSPCQRAHSTDGANLQQQLFIRASRRHSQNMTYTLVALFHILGTHRSCYYK